LSALAVAIVLLLAVVATGSAQAQSYIYGVLYSFTGGADGAYPQAGLVLDAQNNLYGTTTGGGASAAGTVFKVDASGQETVLYSFTGGADGASPYGGVVLDGQGNLYGTTYGGGASGAGTVFKLDTSGNETVLHSFANSPDGANPRAGVVLDAQGNLYGTTSGGGDSYGEGTVFMVDMSGNETLLHTFTGEDGIWPFGGLVEDGQGNLYGTTEWGGGKFMSGTVFEVDATGNFTLLYDFGRLPDGEFPVATLTWYAGGLFGTTSYGGLHNKGTAFWLDPDENVFYYFGNRGSGTYPLSGLVLDANTGIMYGTTSQGGAHHGGTVYELDMYSNQAELHSFSGKKGDGAFPAAGLALGLQGEWINLYGTTEIGGTYGRGTVFALLNSAAATTTALTSAPNPSTYGQAVTFTAVVSGASGAPPNGETVTFMKVKAVLGTGTLSGGSASFTTSALPVGHSVVRAVYGGDALFPGSTSNTVNQVVKR